MKPTLRLVYSPEERTQVYSLKWQPQVSWFSGTLRGLISAIQYLLENGSIISCTRANELSVSLDRDPGGIHSLTQTLIHRFEDLTALPEDIQDLLGGTERQRQLLAQCRLHLEHFMKLSRGTTDSPTPAMPKKILARMASIAWAVGLC